MSGSNVVRLFTAAVTLTGDFTPVNATGLAASQLAVFDPTTGFVSIETVPEPTTLAAAGMAVAVLALRTWRRRTVGRSRRT